MAPQPADRSSYEAAQAAFLRALVRGEAFPEGVVEERAAAASRSLWRKRLRGVALAWPALALGAAFEERFEAYARAGSGPPAVGDGVTDGLAFALALPREELGDDARVELLLVRAVVRGRRGPAMRERRGLFAGAVVLRDPRRMLVVVRAPAIGRRQLVIGLARG